MCKNHVKFDPPLWSRTLRIAQWKRDVVFVWKPALLAPHVLSMVLVGRHSFSELSLLYILCEGGFLTLLAVNGTGDSLSHLLKCRRCLLDFCHPCFQETSTPAEDASSEANGEADAKGTPAPEKSASDDKTAGPSAVEEMVVEQNHHIVVPSYAAWFNYHRYVCMFVVIDFLMFVLWQKSAYRGDSPLWYGRNRKSRAKEGNSKTDRKMERELHQVKIKR